MANSRPQPTLADYMAIAISPALIIVLVSSLAFFLLTVFYAGEFEQRMYWTASCFVFAAVLISRISIMEGAERATLFGLALGVAAGLAMMRFTNHPWWAWLVLGVIWWCASHLVWNCTLVDDEDDASGEGLLQAAGFDAASPDDRRTGESAPSTAQASVARRMRKATAPPAKPTPRQPLAKRLFTWWQRNSSRKAPPGLTVVYFSLAALPIFGLGQHFVQSDSRQYAFQLMVRYVASALGLLLTTSFLGLRRYLRQRRLEMPVEMAATWLAVGTALAAATLLLAMLIPRPNPEYAISSITGSLGSPNRDASRYAPLKESPGQGDSASTTPADDQTPLDENRQPDGQNSSAAQGRGREGGEQSGSTGGSQPPAGTSPAGQQSTAGSGGSQQQSQASAGKSPDGQAEKQESKAGASSNQQPQRDQSQASQEGSQPQSDTEKNSAAQSDEKSDEQKRAQQSQQRQTSSQTAQALSKHAQPPQLPSPPVASSAAWLLWAFRMLLYALAIIAGLYCLIRYWVEVKAFLAGLWNELVGLWQGLFGGRRSVVELAEAPAEKANQVRPFSSYQDPFASGTAGRQPANKIVQYSFEALEAWAAERGQNRIADETPLEFAARLAAEHPPLAAGVQDLASLYARVAYARETLEVEGLVGVERLWGDLRKIGYPASTVRVS